MILSGLGGIVVILTYSAVMQYEFEPTTNRTGQAFAILGIYLFDVCYCESTHSLQNLS